MNVRYDSVNLSNLMCPSRLLLASRNVEMFNSEYFGYYVS